MTTPARVTVEFVGGPHCGDSHSATSPPETIRKTHRAGDPQRAFVSEYRLTVTTKGQLHYRIVPGSIRELPHG